MSSDTTQTSRRKGGQASPSDEEWESHKQEIVRYFKASTLKRARAEMSKVGFEASVKCYKARLKDWKIGKRLTPSDWKFVAKEFAKELDRGVREPVIEAHGIPRGLYELRRHARTRDKTMDELIKDGRRNPNPTPGYIRPIHGDSGAESGSAPPVATPSVAQPLLPAAEPGGMPSNRDAAPVDSLGSHSLRSSGAWHEQRAGSSPLNPAESVYHELSSPAATQQLHLDHWELDITWLLLDVSSHNDAKEPTEVFTTACKVAAMCASTRHPVLQKPSVNDAVAKFQDLCAIQHELLLVTCSEILTWLWLHVDGSLPQQIMQELGTAAGPFFGENDPIRMILEWMAAIAGYSTDASKMQTCRTNAPILQQCSETCKATFGPAHGHTIVAQYCHAFHLMIVDKLYAEAEPLLWSLYNTCVHALGERRALSVSILAGISRAQSKCGNFLGAQIQIDKCIETSPFGRRHPQMLELLVRKAVIYWRLEQYQKCEDVYWEVYRGRIAVLGPHHRFTNAAHDSLMSVMQRTGHWDARKGEVHDLLTDPGVSVSEYERWWADQVEEASRERPFVGDTWSEEES